MTRRHLTVIYHREMGCPERERGTHRCWECPVRMCCYLTPLMNSCQAVTVNLSTVPSLFLESRTAIAAGWPTSTHCPPPEPE